MSSEIAKCEICGEPMPPGEQMFKFHGYSGPCPKPPLTKPGPPIIALNLCRKIEDIRNLGDDRNTVLDLIDHAIAEAQAADRATITRLESDLATLRERVRPLWEAQKKATPGPWVSHQEENELPYLDAGSYNRGIAKFINKTDADLSAAARNTDLSDLFKEPSRG